MLVVLVGFLLLLLLLGLVVDGLVVYEVGRGVGLVLAVVQTHVPLLGVAAQTGLWLLTLLLLLLLEALVRGLSWRRRSRGAGAEVRERSKLVVEFVLLLLMIMMMMVRRRRRVRRKRSGEERLVWVLRVLIAAIFIFFSVRG